MKKIRVGRSTTISMHNQPAIDDRDKISRSLSRGLGPIGTRRGKKPIAAWPHRRRESLTPAERDRYPTTSILSNSRSRFVARDSPRRPVRPTELRILRSFHLAARSTRQPPVSIQSFLRFVSFPQAFRPFFYFLFYLRATPHGPTERCPGFVRDRGS